MTDRFQKSADDRVRSGRRLAIHIDAPRDKTVCFTVSEDERIAVDLLAASLSRTRSSILTRIVTAFVADTMTTGEPENLQELLKECRASSPVAQIPPNRK